MDVLELKGYKSIKDMELELKPINLMIGSNGAGKSNLLSFFEFINNIYEQKLAVYSGLNGGCDKFLYRGEKETSRIEARLVFGNGTNAYSFVLEKGDDSFIFIQEQVWYKDNPLNICSYGKETNLKSNTWYRSDFIRKYLCGLRKHHFHDTGRNSPFNKSSHVENDVYYLYEKGDNIAAYLYNIRKTNPFVYNRIRKVIQSVAPYFSDFYLEPNSEELVRLQWQDKYSSTIYGPTDFSDGTMRFIALTTLFMQPILPQAIIIDEPELGLHPVAIKKLAGMMQNVAAAGVQIIAATQSAELVSLFVPEDVITVNQCEDGSIFCRLSSSELNQWLDSYTLGDLWKQNIIEGGQPE